MLSQACRRVLPALLALLVALTRVPAWFAALVNSAMRRRLIATPVFRASSGARTRLNALLVMLAHLHHRTAQQPVNHAPLELPVTLVSRVALSVPTVSCLC